MNTKEILLTEGFAKSISNLGRHRHYAEGAKNILKAKSATKFMEAVNAISVNYSLKGILLEEAQIIYNEFGFAEYSSSVLPFERYNEFIAFLKFNYDGE